MALVLAVLACCVSLGNSLFDRSWRVPFEPDSPATAWVEEHVPPGTPVYWSAGLVHLLPTPEAADRAWQQFTVNGWRGKLKWGTNTIGVKLDADPPRALSFDNQSKELAAARAMFILGSRTSLPIPRFDVRLFGPDANLLDDLSDLYRQSGGVYVVFADSPPKYAGRVVASWTPPHGPSTYVFATDDVKLK
jgi:hypothetical protein